VRRRDSALVATIACLALGCGRIGFSALGSGGGGGGGSGGDGGTTGDGGPDASSARANRVFVSSAVITGNMNGLAGADALCATAANGHLPGQFVAWLSTTTVDARDRLAGSRGWERVDGQPVADTLDTMLAGKMFAPIDLDELGTFQNYDTWTGTGADGRYEPTYGTCNDWTVATIPNQGTDGIPTQTPSGSTDVSMEYGVGLSCQVAAHVYCFEVGFDRAVAPQPIAGKIAFLSTPISGLTGPAAFDTRCSTEATAAALPGTYLAAVATTARTIIGRFTLDATPWRRVDGAEIAANGNALFSTTPLAFINQTADGTYVPYPWIWMGASSPSALGTNASTCNNWTANTSSPSLGLPYDITGLWQASIGLCTDTNVRVLCLQT
jgi:hypothetical protein